MTKEQQIDRIIKHEIFFNCEELLQMLQGQEGFYTYEVLDNAFDDSTEAIEEWLDDEDIEHLELSTLEKSELAEENGFEPQPKEIFEWWAVSKRLYDKLNQLEEPVLEVAGMYVWGRTCSGQAIDMDNVIDRLGQSIAS